MELHEATTDGDHRRVLSLLRDGVSANETPEHFLSSPLHKAATLGKSNGLSIIRALVSAGASVNKKDHLNRTALHEAARHDGSEATLAELLKAGGDPNIADHLLRTPLHEAARKGSVSACLTLLRSGADLYAVDSFQLTPLDLAKDSAVKDAMLREWKALQLEKAGVPSSITRKFKSNGSPIIAPRRSFPDSDSLVNPIGLVLSESESIPARRGVIGNGRASDSFMSRLPQTDDTLSFSSTDTVSFLLRNQLTKEEIAAAVDGLKYCVANVQQIKKILGDSSMNGIVEGKIDVGDLLSRLNPSDVREAIKLIDSIRQKQSEKDSSIETLELLYNKSENEKENLLLEVQSYKNEIESLTSQVEVVKKEIERSQIQSKSVVRQKEKVEAAILILRSNEQIEKEKHLLEQQQLRDEINCLSKNFKQAHLEMVASRHENEQLLMENKKLEESISSLQQLNVNILSTHISKLNDQLRRGDESSRSVIDFFDDISHLLTDSVSLNYIVDIKSQISQTSNKLCSFSNDNINLQNELRDSLSENLILRNKVSTLENAMNEILNVDQQLQQNVSIWETLSFYFQKEGECSNNPFVKSAVSNIRLRIDDCKRQSEDMRLLKQELQDDNLLLRNDITTFETTLSELQDKMSSKILSLDQQLQQNSSIWETLSFFFQQEGEFSLDPLVKSSATNIGRRIDETEAQLLILTSENAALLHRVSVAEAFAMEAAEASARSELLVAKYSDASEKILDAVGLRLGEMDSISETQHIRDLEATRDTNELAVAAAITAVWDELSKENQSSVALNSEVQRLKSMVSPKNVLLTKIQDDTYSNANIQASLLRFIENTKDDIEMLEKQIKTESARIKVVADHIWRTLESEDDRLASVREECAMWRQRLTDSTDECQRTITALHAAVARVDKETHRSQNAESELLRFQHKCETLELENKNLKKTSVRLEDDVARLEDDIMELESVVNVASLHMHAASGSNNKS